MYDQFDACIFDFSLEREPGDYWYDCAILESTEILRKFGRNDWEILLSQIKLKSLFWKKRLIECLGDLHTPYELKVILSVIDSGDKDLFIDCVDSLRSLDLSEIRKDEKDILLYEAKCLLNEVVSPVKDILEDLINKIIKSDSES